MIVQNYTMDVTKEDMIQMKWLYRENQHTRYISTVADLREFFIEAANSAGLGVPGLRIKLEYNDDATT